MMKPTLEGLELLFEEYSQKLSAFHRTAALNSVADVKSDGEREHRGMENHRLHVEAHHAGEIYRGALRSLFT